MSNVSAAVRLRCCWRGWLCIVLMVSPCATAPAAANPAIDAESQPAYAIVIGNNAAPVPNPSSLARLRFADDDAARYFQLFGRYVAKAHLLSVLDRTSQRRFPGLAQQSRPPSAANLRRAVRDIAQRVARDRAAGLRPTFYLAFSGHGALDQEGVPFLALLDSALSRESLYRDVLAAVSAEYTHVLIDACHAGGVVGVRGEGFFADEREATRVELSDRQREEELDLRQRRRMPHVGFVLATTAGHESHEWSAIESGVFSHELLSGLSGAADVNGDRRIEYSELHAFVASANRNLADQRAVPRVVVRPPLSNNNVPLIALDQARDVSRLSGRVSGLGRFLIELENGQRYLDANLADGTQATIVVPRGAVVYLRSGRREARLPQRDTIDIGQLEFTRRQASARGSLDASYRDKLFSFPYGATYYRGFIDSRGLAGVSFAHSPAVRPPHSVEGGGRRKIWSLAAIGLSAIAAGAAITAGVLAVDAERDFDATDKPRPAAEASDRYDRFFYTSIAAATVSVASAVAAWLLWPGQTSDDGSVDPLRVGVGGAPVEGGAQLQVRGIW